MVHIYRLCCLACKEHFFYRWQLFFSDLARGRTFGWLVVKGLHITAHLFPSGLGNGLALVESLKMSVGGFVKTFVVGLAPCIVSLSGRTVVGNRDVRSISFLVSLAALKSGRLVVGTSTGSYRGDSS